MTDIDDSALTPRRDALTQYVIYDHPRDHPEHFVVRPWDVQAGRAVAREAAGLFRDLTRARAYCAQFGLVCIGRQDGDDPAIIETWT